MSSRDGIPIIDLYAKGRTTGRRWWARVWDRRSRRYSLSRTFETKDEARRWAIEQRHLLDKGLRQAGRPTLQAIGTRWCDEMARRGLNKGHVGRARRLLQQLAEAKIDDVLNPNFAPDLAHWLQNLTAITTNRDGRTRRRRPELTNSTKNRILAFIRAMLHYAMKQGWLAVDPVRGLGMLPETRLRKQVFTVAELRTLMEDRNRSDPFWLTFAVMIYTGMRVGEALHLRWEGIQFSSGNIVLRRHADFDLKTDEERHVPLQEELAAILKPLVQADGWIVSDEAIRKASAKGLWVQFRRFLDRCGVKPQKRSPHSTRHSWVAMMLATGSNLLDVKEWAGHRNLSTTERYAGERGTYRTTVVGWPPGGLCLRTCADMATIVKLSALSAGLALEADDQVFFNVSATPMPGGTSSVAVTDASVPVTDTSVPVTATSVPVAATSVPVAPPLYLYSPLPSEESHPKRITNHHHHQRALTGGSS